MPIINSSVRVCLSDFRHLEKKSITFLSMQRDIYMYLIVHKGRKGEGVHRYMHLIHVFLLAWQSWELPAV